MGFDVYPSNPLFRILSSSSVLLRQRLVLMKVFHGFFCRSVFVEYRHIDVYQNNMRLVFLIEFDCSFILIVSFLRLFYKFL